MPAFQWYKRIPGRTQQQTDNIARRLQRSAEEKEKYCTVEAPGDVTVTAQMTMSLTGTGTGWDQSYNIESVEHHFDVHAGYRMTVTGKNSGTGDTGYTPESGDTLSSPSSPTSLPSSPGFTTQSGGGDVTPQGGGALGG